MNTLLCSTLSRNQPCVILDLLNTFYDDHVSIHEADRLLKSCLGQIQRLVLAGPVVLTLARLWRRNVLFYLSRSAHRQMKC